MITKENILKDLEIIHTDKELNKKYQKIFINYLYTIHKNEYSKINLYHNNLMFGHNMDLTTKVKSNFSLIAYVEYINNSIFEYRFTSISVDDIFDYLIKFLRKEKLNDIYNN